MYYVCVCVCVLFQGDASQSFTTRNLQRVPSACISHSPKKPPPAICAHTHAYTHTKD